MHRHNRDDGVLFEAWVWCTAIVSCVSTLFWGAHYISEGITDGSIRALYVIGMCFVLAQTPLVFNALGSYFWNQTKRQRIEEHDLV